MRNEGGFAGQTLSTAPEGGEKPKTETLSLQAVIDKVDRATGPDPVLAAHLHCALRGYQIHEDTDPADGIFAFWEGEPWKSLCSNCSNWSDPAQSVDKAMELLPSGWRLQHLGQSHKFDRWCAQIYKDGSESNPAFEDDIAMISRTGNTAALAIVHVALLAHRECLTPAIQRSKGKEK